MSGSAPQGNKVRVALTIAIALALAGCASVGPEMNLAQTSKIRKGSTTRAQVEQLMGKPTSVVQMPDGKIMERWLYSKSYDAAESSTMIGYNTNLDQTLVATHSQTLQVSYDAKGVVEDLISNDSTSTERFWK